MSLTGRFLPLRAESGEPASVSMRPVRGSSASDLGGWWRPSWHVVSTS
jgi:hypothetical protein